MSLSRRLVEAPPSLRWHAGRARTALYRRAFAAIGAGTVIVRPLRLRGVEHISLGAHCAVYEDAWLQVEGDTGRITIGDRVYLGHGVHIHSIAPISIGSGCVFADHVFVGSTDHDRHDRHAAVGTGPIEIGTNVFLGQNVTVLGGVTIGSGATVGAGAVVTRSVRANAVVAGIPARELPGRAG